MNLRQEWDSIDADEAKAATLDDRKWAFAKRLAESVKTQVQLADETGRHQTTVARWQRAHREYAHAHNRPLFNDAIDWASGSNKRSDVATKVLRAADDDVLETIVDTLDREQQTALERAVRKALKPANVKKGEAQRKDVSRWASDGAMAWFSVAEQLANEGVSVPDGADRETLKRSMQATRTFLDVVDRVLNEEITVEEFAAALDDRDAVKEFLSA